MQYFGYVSGWGLLLNGIFVPLVSAVFAVLLCLVMLSALFPIELVFLLLRIPNVVWSTVLLLFQTFDFSSFAIEGWRISTLAHMAYYAGCLFLTDKWNVKKSFSKGLSILCFLAFAISMVALNI